MRDFKTIKVALMIVIPAGLVFVFFMVHANSPLVIDEPISTHDEILDLLNLASQDRNFPEEGVVIVNVDSHCDFNPGARYIDFFSDIHWDRENMQEKFKEFYGFNSDKRLLKEWNVALEILEGSWCDIAKAKSWAKDIIWINPKTFKNWLNRPEHKANVISRLKDAKSIWLTVDYDYFSCQQPKRHIEVEDAASEIVLIKNFFKENKIKINRLVPCLSEKYVNKEADEDYLLKINEELLAAFEANTTQAKAYAAKIKRGE